MVHICRVSQSHTFLRAFGDNHACIVKNVQERTQMTHDTVFLQVNTIFGRRYFSNYNANYNQQNFSLEAEDTLSSTNVKLTKPLSDQVISISFCRNLRYHYQYQNLSIDIKERSEEQIKRRSDHFCISYRYRYQDQDHFYITFAHPCQSHYLVLLKRS